ncbi:transmembrane protein 47-like isoform X2 [Ruditapes philippinarum]|uniref:transmembrane protein 47-like isoform X2 n=1 Tax=Ruditapes philippinarum TaxID=129788 RepID=UPI00295B6993|nr:transmembrane protein 47-like isoform X2 [Ruditapes philippinarum]
MSDTEKMAPTASIEAVMVVRPYKVVALLLGFINLIVMTMFIGASTWVHLGDVRMGLWEECVIVTPGRIDCFPNEEPPDWMLASRGLCLLGLILCFCASVVVCIGINAGKFRTRYRCYFVAMLIYFLGVMFDTTALIIYPVKYSEQIGMRAGNESWSFGWAYGLGWGSTALMAFSAILLCLDKDADEVIMREVTDYENGIEEDEIRT